jgi:hypothetical protein
MATSGASSSYKGDMSFNSPQQTHMNATIWYCPAPLVEGCAGVRVGGGPFSDGFCALPELLTLVIGSRAEERFLQGRPENAGKEAMGLYYKGLYAHRRPATVFLMGKR